MFLHVGQEVMIRASEIVAILDSSILDQSNETRQFFNRLRALDRVEGDVPSSKSMIVTDRGIYLSKISTSTLARRGYNDAIGRGSEER